MTGLRIEVGRQASSDEISEVEVEQTSKRVRCRERIGRESNKERRRSVCSR